MLGIVLPIPPVLAGIAAALGIKRAAPERDEATPENSAAPIAGPGPFELAQGTADEVPVLAPRPRVIWSDATWPGEPVWADPYTNNPRGYESPAELGGN